MGGFFLNWKAFFFTHSYFFFFFKKGVSECKNSFSFLFFLKKRL